MDNYQNNLKRCWITEHDAGFQTLSLQSEHVSPEYRRISAYSRIITCSPSQGGDRHIIVIGLLSVEDLIEIRETITRYLMEP